MLARMWQKRNHLHCWHEHKVNQSLWKTVWRFLNKAKISAIVQSSYLVSEYTQRKSKNTTEASVHPRLLTQ